MPELVRVRDNVTGHHLSITARLAEINPKRYTLLKQPAVDVNGRPLPAKSHVALAPRQGQGHQGRRNHRGQ